MYEPGCGTFNSVSSEDVWFSVTVPSSGIVNLQAIDDASSAGIFYPAISLYEGSCSSLTHAGCSQTTSSVTPASSQYIGTPGSTLFVRVHDYNDNTGQFQLCASAPSATYGNVFTGTNSLSCGSTLTFMDPGGTGNYALNQAATYTICPSSSGQYVSVNFSSFNLESGYDRLIIMNGSSSLAPIIGSYTGSTNPGIITSSASNGCLTFTFQSDNAVVSSGWNAIVSCTSSPGTNVTSTYCSSTNCNGGCGTPLCSDGSYPTQNSGSSGVEELNEHTAGCLGGAGEIASKWFYFTTTSAGTISFSLDGPSGQDYDFAIWGPTTNGTPPCPLATGDSPIRCSYSAASNPVGLGNGATDFYEEANGDGWLAPLSVQAGQTYAMLLNIFQNGNPQPTITLDLTGTGSLSCNIALPVSYIDFYGVNQNDKNILSWITENEINNDFFTLEKSANGETWDVIGNIAGAQNSQNRLFYSMVDETPTFPTSYYRLKQTDLDGEFTYSNTITINSRKSQSTIIGNIFPNPGKNIVSFLYTGDDVETPLNVEIVSELGVTITSMQIRNIIKGMPQNIPIHEIENGLYHIKVVQGEHQSVQKLMILH